MPESKTILKANLSALSQANADLATRLNDVQSANLQWAESKAGPSSATLSLDGGKAMALASRYDPKTEAQRLIEPVDFRKSACVVVMGFGLGYHVAAASEAMKDGGLLVIYEPDTAQLRAVLEHLDYRKLLGRRNVLVFDDTVDRAKLTAQLEKFSSVITQGTQLIVHPPSRQRFGEAIKQFGQMVTDTLAYCRTTVATALVNSARTCRNLACNLPHYAAGATVNELHNAAKGYPAICVSAGPSLVKNVDLLRDPEVRKNVVIISVQTTLKPLLDRGIHPDFVTALDYSPICQRFYEGLPPLPDVTLVVEPKANPIILDSFPGPIRTAASTFNDQLLGDMARPIIPMPGGATVAHLSFYLAQFLGCDPIIFIGQDLGFSDGLYYAPGTAVHNVWSSEINAFNTIEMMEWQRIVRHKGHLRRDTDVHDQSIFTDEQMLTYLKQFERDFARAEQTILDATEGGLPKEYTEQVTLQEALSTHATRPVPKLPLVSTGLEPQRLDQVIQLLSDQIEGVQDLRHTTKETVPILRQMTKHQRDSNRMAKLFEKLNKKQRHVEEDLRRAFQSVSQLNTIGAYKRARADRMIGYLDGDNFDRQREQIDRDLENLDFLIQCCDEGLEIFREAFDRATSIREQQKNLTPQAA